MSSAKTRDLIRLSLGWPSESLFATRELKAACIQTASGDKATLEQGSADFTKCISYGDFAGSPAFREALADFLTKTYKRLVSPNAIFLTAGAGSAIDMICTIFAERGDTVLVEPASYHLAQQIFRDHGLRLQPMPARPDGALDLQRLETQVRKSPKSIPLMYLVPTYSNPTGRTLSHSERQEIVRIADHREMIIIADEVYHLLKFPMSANPPLPLCEYDETGGTVLSLGSFTKTPAPGLRVGWIQIGTPKNSLRLEKKGRPAFERMERFGVVRGGGSLNHFTSMLIATMLRSSLQSSHLLFLREKLESRAIAICEAIRSFFPEHEGTFDPPQGGYYVWLKLPQDGSKSLDMDLLQQIANRRGVDFFSGSKFLVPGTGLWNREAENAIRQHLRLCFAYYDERMIQEGVRRLSLSYIEALKAGA